MSTKKIVFGIIAVLLPFALLMVAELCLRMLKVDAEHQDAFLEITEREGYRAFNPLYPARYFRAFSPSVSFDPFSAVKEAGSFRVVALGGSSAAGFPYSHSNAFPALLEGRLRRYAFGQQIEMISLAMTAVNSFTLWDLADDVVALQPDAVVIYAGHNEFYGAFGVGSAEYGIGLSVWPKRLLLRLKHLVLFRLLERLIVGGGPNGSDGSDGRTMMAKVIGKSGITYGSETFIAGIRQFDANMSAVLRAFGDAGIPVFIGTLAANLADQPPLGSDVNALRAFSDGKRALNVGDPAKASQLLNRARDLDDVRFRAPDTLNTVIQALSDRFGAIVVDTKARLIRESPAGILGASLFEDHLHPNQRGYALVADEFFEAIRTADKLSASPLEGWDEIVESRDPLDDARANLQIARLTGGYPFNKEIDEETELANYRSTIDAYLNSGNPFDSLAALTAVSGLAPQEALRLAIRIARASRDTLSAIALSKSLIFWQPFNVALQDDLVGYASNDEHFDKENEELVLAAYSVSRSTFHLNTLAALSLRQGHVRDARLLLGKVESVEPLNRVMLYNTARVLLLTGDTLGARTYAERFQSMEP